MSGLIIVPKVLSLIVPSGRQLIRTNKRDDKSMGKGVIGRGREARSGVCQDAKVAAQPLGLGLVTLCFLNN